MNIERRFAERAWDDFMDLEVMWDDVGTGEPGLEKVTELMAKVRVIVGDLRELSRHVDLRHCDAASSR